MNNQTFWNFYAKIYLSAWNKKHTEFIIKVHPSGMKVKASWLFVMHSYVFCIIVEPNYLWVYFLCLSPNDIWERLQPLLDKIEGFLIRLKRAFIVTIGMIDYCMCTHAHMHTYRISMSYILLSMPEHLSSVKQNKKLWQCVHNTADVVVMLTGVDCLWTTVVCFVLCHLLEWIHLDFNLSWDNNSIKSVYYRYHNRKKKFRVIAATTWKLLRFYSIYAILSKI